MTPQPGSKVTPQLGSYICSFLVNYTSEKSTPEPPGDNFDPLMALPASFLLPGTQPRELRGKIIRHFSLLIERKSPFTADIKGGAAV